MPQLKDYLRQVEETDSPGLITNATEWVLEGWGIDDEDVSPEQLAAALFMEANTQDQCVIDGESAPEYPKQLRDIAHQILQLCGHGDPVGADMRNTLRRFGIRSLYQVCDHILPQDEQESVQFKRGYAFARKSYKDALV